MLCCISAAKVNEFRGIWNLLSGSLDFDERENIFLNFTFLQGEADLLA
jgi:hypothetical protein